MQLDDLNGLTIDAATAELLRCCGSLRWAESMVARRPFGSLAEVADAADGIWRSLAREDWIEAFAAHPRIGGVEAGPGEGPAMAGEAGRGKGDEPGDGRWPAAEQSGMAGASAEVRRRLVEANQEYQSRFGYIFIVCATGKSAAEMLAILERRLPNASGEELDIAAEEQRKITRLRLDKLLT